MVKEKCTDILILGAGLAGIGAGRKLLECDFDFRIVEASDSFGGLARTDIIDGFSFDYAGHFLHFASPQSERFFLSHGVDMVRVQRRASILIGDVPVPYPLQFNLWALGEEFGDRVVAEMKAAADAELESLDRSLYERLRGVWGPTLFESFFRPYNEKLWRRDLHDLPADCLGRFPPAPDLALVREGCRSQNHAYGYNAAFWYPATGGIGAWSQALADPLIPYTDFDTTVARVDLDEKRVYCANGTSYRYKSLINTLPLSSFIEQADGIESTLPLNHTVMTNIRLGLRGTCHTRDHWLYIPDENISFYRVNIPSNIDPNLCPDGCFILSLEYTHKSPSEECPTESIAREAIDYLSNLNLIDSHELIVLDTARISPAYVTTRSSGHSDFEAAAECLMKKDTYLAGRFGSWDYLSMEGAYHTGDVAAAECTQRMKSVSH